MAQTVVGIFDSSSDAQNAVQQLMSSGFTQDSIDISTQNATDTTSNNYDDGDNDSIGGFFRSLFGSDDDDNYRNYSQVARRGSVITVHARTADEATRAATILDNAGAVDVDERARQYQSSGTAQYGSTSGVGTSDFTNETTNKSIPIIEEELQVGKRVVETGGARLRSRIIERPVEETLRLRHERVRVERNTVNRPATEADLANFRTGEQTIEVREHAEVPVVSKEARVVEEISLGKEVEEHQETVRDTVRRTDVQVDDLTTDVNRTSTSSGSSTSSTGLTDADRGQMPNL